MELKSILESLLFASQKPLSPRELRDYLGTAAEQSEDPAIKAMKKIREEELVATLELLEAETAALNRSYRLACVAGSWQFVSQPEYAPWLKAMVGEKNRPTRLSQPALETLTIIAYRQPLTRAEIEQIRGVAVDGVMQTLLERGLVEQAGRAEVVGRPMTYATTELFLQYFGLRSLEELPAADELRRIVVQRPEALATAEPDAASPVPPDGEAAPSEAAQASEAQAEPKPENAPAAISEPDSAQPDPARS